MHVKGKTPDANEEESLLNAKDPKVMITQDYLVIFYLETNDNKKGKKPDDEFDYYSSVEQNYVRVKDV
jgi:hypothetical protein